MTFRTAALAALTASITLLGAASAGIAHAQSAPDSQWHGSPLTLSTLLQDGYRIAAVVNDAHSGGDAENTIFVQRDQSAFKCIDPQPSDAKNQATATSPACYELIPPSAAASGSDSK